MEQQQKGAISLSETNNAADVALAMVAAGTGKRNSEHQQQHSPPRNTRRKAKEIDILATKVANKLAKSSTILNAGVTPKMKPKKDNAGDADAGKAPCPHCGKIHKDPPEKCWNRPGTRNARRKANQILRAAPSSENEETTDEEAVNDEEVCSSCVRLLPSHVPLPSTCTVLNVRSVQIDDVALPDTQAQLTVTPNKDHVMRLHEDTHTLKGIAGAASIHATSAEIAVPLETDTGDRYNLVIGRAKDGTSPLFAPQATALVLAHEDLERVGLHVDYTVGKILTPNADTITMVKRNRTWQIPLWRTTATRKVGKTPVSAKPQGVATHNIFNLLPDDVSEPETPANPHPNVALQNRIWMGLSSSSLLKLYDFYDRTGFGNASKADIRRFRDPTCDLMRGRATYVKSPRVKSAQNDSLRRVRFNPTLDVLRYDDEQPILETQVQGERTSTLAPVAAQGETITTLPSFSTTFKQKAGITKRHAGRAGCGTSIGA